LEALLAISQAVAWSLDLEELLEDVLKKSLAALEVECGGIYLLDPDRERMTLHVHRSLPGRCAQAVQHIHLGEGFLGQAMVKRKPVVLNLHDYPTDPLASLFLQERLPILVSTPLISQGQMVGAMLLTTERRQEFRAWELDLLTVIGQLLGIAADHARLREETRRRMEYLMVLNRASRRVSQWGLDLEGVLHAIVTSLVEEIGMTFARIWLADESGEELILRASAGLYTRLDGSRARIRLREYPYKLAQIARERRPLVTNRVQEDDRFDRAWAREQGLVAFAGYPLLKDGHLVAVLVAFSRRPLDHVILDVLGAFVNQAAIAIESAKLYEELREAKEELEEKVEKLETFYRITMGREKRIVELKQEVRRLKERLRELGEEVS